MTTNGSPEVRSYPVLFHSYFFSFLVRFSIVFVRLYAYEATRTPWDYGRCFSSQFVFECSHRVTGILVHL